MFLSLSPFVWALSLISFFFWLRFLLRDSLFFLHLNFPIMMQQNFERLAKVLWSCFAKSLSMS